MHEYKLYKQVLSINCASKQQLNIFKRSLSIFFLHYAHVKVRETRDTYLHKTKVIRLVSLYLILLTFCYIRFIPQGTVDNNLGPDRLAGPKSLDLNYSRQPTLWLHDLCLEVLTDHGNELRLFGANTFPLLIL